MFPSSQDLAAPGRGSSDLEDRLRGLILSHVNEVPGGGNQLPFSSPVRPYMSTVAPANQQEYLAPVLPLSPTPPSRMAGRNQAMRQDYVHMNLHPEFEAPTDILDRSPQRGRNRFNQERRQMQSQPSVSTNATLNQGTQSGRGFASPAGKAQPGWGAPHFNSHSQSNHDQRHPQQQQQQQYSQRFSNQGAATPYSPHTPYSRGNPQSSMNQHQADSSSGYVPQNIQAPNQFQQYQPGNRAVPGTPYGRTPPQNRQLFQPGPYGGQGRGRQSGATPEEIANQSSYLVKLLQDHVSTVGMDAEEEAEKETFRAVVENACRDAIIRYEREELGNSNFDASSVELKCFGSMSSGFATKASDMDLALLTPLSKPAADSPESPIPRLLERTLLDLGYGARLLTRTRVPIIKLCQKPTEKLLSDLLEARAKWENGFNAEPEDEDEEAADDEPKTSDDHEGLQKEKVKVMESPAPSPAETTCCKPGSREDEISKLKQKDNQSLGDYFNAAKRLLRRLGGRDVSVGSPNFTEEESSLLNDVCRAFISGLLYEPLIARLRTYQTISPLFDPSLPPIQRSLNGVWTQIEGERFAMAFENRSLTEANERHEDVCLKLVEAWRSIQDNAGVFMEPVLYNRQLYVAAEKLKAMSSLQLMFLEQIQYEDPVFYHRRAQRILDDLKGEDLQKSETVTAIVISHYISGINNPQIRETMQNAMQTSSYNTRTLKDVAFRHRILQLAIDYEHALKKEVYQHTDRSTVEQYIDFLRNKVHEDKIEPNLLAKIRALPDPTVMSPNKPRDRYRDQLEFPKTDVGIQCDINFSAHLALHNTLLLRCYSNTDPRVKPMILFIKHWAKVRGINTPYRGTLSSYGYVLMVLHYLVNVAQPFVCPNLQLLHRDPPSYLPPAEIEARTTCNGRDVRFWRNESEIRNLSSRGMLNHNHDSIGVLLRGFFEYFAQGGQMTTVRGRGFDWGREVLSLRTEGGIVSKQEKGWVGAKTVVETTTIAAPLVPPTPGRSKDQNDAQYSPDPDEEGVAKATKHQVKTIEETKEVRHRYLFAIEDPFELDHNVARTVTHNGIVAIRDEFRRAWRLIKSIGRPGQNEGLLDPVNSGKENQGGLQELLDLIHGK